jgi:hypothetical protein
MYIQYIQDLFQSRLGTADYALVTSSLHYNDSLDTLTHKLARSLYNPITDHKEGTNSNIVPYPLSQYVFTVLLPSRRRLPFFCYHDTLFKTAAYE